MPKTVRMARPKTGRKTYSHTVSLTLEQIDFLSNFPNSSGFLRKMLDDIITEQHQLDAALPSLTLKYKIDVLEMEVAKLTAERQHTSAEGCWLKAYKLVYVPDLNRPGETTPKYVDVDTPEGAYYRKLYQTYDDRTAGLKQRIEELRKKFIC